MKHIIDITTKTKVQSSNLNNPKQKPWLGIITFLVVLAIWEVSARFSSWSTHIFPDPLTVVMSLGELIKNGTLLRHTIASLYRVTAGFYLAILFGVPAGIMLGRVQMFQALINPLVQFN